RYRDVYLHAEWTTCKEGTGQHYGRYRNVNGHYMPHREGKAGFIDLAIGPYLQPSGAVEFSLKYGWCHEEIAYDFLKLMDPANPFLMSISFNVILRDNLVTLCLADLA